MTTVIDDLKAPRWKMVQKEAEKLSADFSAPPIPVQEIAETNGVDVVFANFGSVGEKVAGFCDFKAEKLFVNIDDPLNRQTFTIAHELGHWMLHRDFFDANPERYSILPRFQKTGKNDAFEQEANHFAANLLVPKHLLLPVKNAPASQLASIFAVSRMMMEIRLKNV